MPRPRMPFGLHRLDSHSLDGARRSLRAILFLLALAFPAIAHAEDATYRTPPAPVGDILTAPRLPAGAPALSPDGARALVPELPSLISIATLAEPVEKLAGLEFVPGLRATRTALKQAGTGFTIVTLANAAKVRAQLPAGARISSVRWSNDSRRIACTVTATGGADVYVVDAATGTARKLEGVKANGGLVSGLEWSADDRELWLAAVPANLGPLADPSRVPEGPQVRVGAGRATPQRTSRDVLKTASDQERFAYFVRSQLVRVPVDGGAPVAVGAPALLRSWELAPDEQHLIVATFPEKAPFGFPWYLFPVSPQIWNRDGTLAAKLEDAPLNDRSAISSVAPLGPRDVGFSDDGKAVYWCSWQDTPGADAQKAIRDTTLAQPGADRLMRLAAPFTGTPEVIATIPDMAIEDWTAIAGGSRLLLSEAYEPRRVQRAEWIDTARPDARGVLWKRSTEGVYDEPGTPLGRRTGHHTALWTSRDGRSIWLAGRGFRPDGQRPFLDRVDLATAKRTRRFESDALHLESPVAILDPEAARVVTTRETNHEPRNYWLRTAGKKSGLQLTQFADPAPALTTSQRVQFTFVRPDSVKLNAEAVLPADWKPGHPLPTVFWIYPNDYRSAAAASQNRRSPNRFPSQSALNPEVLVTQGYCVVYPDIAVVGTNDRYVQEIQVSAQAAVDECVKRGFTDRARIGVGGHSYGAFSTANMLAHTDLFKAGIASDGAYNRTLTPFTFQAEERTLWQAPKTYLDMSPFMHADQIRSPLLLLHNLDDTNVGTNPIQSERMYEALNGMGKTVTLVQYPYEDHGPAARETVLDYWSRVIEWFDRYVKNPAGGSAPTASGSAAP